MIEGSPAHELIGYGLSKMFLIGYVKAQGREKFYVDNNIQVCFLFFLLIRFIRCAQGGVGLIWGDRMP